MNGFRKILIKIGVCRLFLSKVSSEDAQATIEWIKTELDNAIVNCIECANVSNKKREIEYAKKFINEKRQDLKELIPNFPPGLFLVSVATHILSDLHETRFFDYFEHILDGLLNLEEYADKDCIETRILSCAFADKLEELMDKY